MEKSDKSNHNHNHSSKCEFDLNNIFDFSDLALDRGVIICYYLAHEMARHGIKWNRIRWNDIAYNAHCYVIHKSITFIII